VVRSKHKTKLSRVSAEASATTAPAVTVVPGLRATADGARVDLEWKPVTQALRYEILHYATTVDEQGEVVGSTTGTRYTDTAIEPSLFGIQSFAIGDVTSDGRADLVTTVSANSPESQLVVHPQTATGGLGPAVQYASYDSPEPLTLADMNGDGRTDVAVAHGGWYAGSVLLQRPDGLLGRGQRSWIPYASHYDYRGIAVGDLDADGKPDIALADYNQGLIVLQQT